MQPPLSPDIVAHTYDTGTRAADLEISAYSWTTASSREGSVHTLAGYARLLERDAYMNLHHDHRVEYEAMRMYIYFSLM
jgi:hypothetical protein